jgi:hypothetical protein
MGKQGLIHKQVPPAKLSLDPVRIKSHGFIEQQPSRFGEGVLWCTDYGRLTVIEPAEEGWERHEFFLHDNPNGPGCSS